MRKLTMALALAVVLIPLLATAALAARQIIQCTSTPCYGGQGDDRILPAAGCQADHGTPGGAGAAHRAPRSS